MLRPKRATEYRRSGPPTVNRNYRHYRGTTPHAVTTDWLFPSVPSDFTGIIEGNRHYSSISATECYYSGQPALLNRHYRGLQQETGTTQSTLQRDLLHCCTPTIAARVQAVVSIVSPTRPLSSRDLARRGQGKPPNQNTPGA